MTLPVVVACSRWARGPVVTVSTILDAPGRPGAAFWAYRRREPPPGRCRDCRRPVVRTPLRQGLGPKCWAKANMQPRRSARPATTPRAAPGGGHEGPDLLDLLAELAAAPG